MGNHDSTKAGIEMDPYYNHMHTFGPTDKAGVDAGGHQLFGSEHMFGAKLPQRMTLSKLLLENDKLRLYGAHEMGNVASNTAAATAGGATVALLSGAVLTGLAINYALGRFVGAPAIEYFSGNKLTAKQKNAVGITAMIF